MRTIISASRRTDIPAYYMSWLINALQKGYADVGSPYGKEYRVGLKKDEVHTLVLWSKNFAPFLKKQKNFRGYHLFFNFTVNDCPLLEPNIPPLSERLKQIVELAKTYSPERINWRFDPLVFWNEGKNNNMESFENIADAMAAIRIRRCLFSFCTYYRKVVSRFQKNGIEFYDPPVEEKLMLVARLRRVLQERGLTLFNCCNKEIIAAGIPSAHCVDGNLLERLAGYPASRAHDRSQRNACGCTKSADIGSYQLKCRHGCLYCYANPVF